MHNITRRYFLLGSAAFPVACAINRGGSPPASQQVRQPNVGQSWRYAKSDLITSRVLDTQTDQVAAVGQTVDIDSRLVAAADKGPAHSSSWGTNWLRKHADAVTPETEVLSEIQDPWGKVLVDPHWSKVQVFETPILLWPAELRPGWSTNIKTKYRVAENGDAYPWEQTMKADSWETVTVPAGQFKALRFSNLINFRDSDFARTAAVRQETVWFAPEVGRWVARESKGTYYLVDSVSDQAFNENYYRWELLAWT